MTATTIKVPSDLRDRLNAEARQAGLTVAEVIENLIRERERSARFREMAAARARTTPQQWAEYASEDEEWERASLDDLRRDNP